MVMGCGWGVSLAVEARVLVHRRLREHPAAGARRMNGRLIEVPFIGLVGLIRSLVSCWRRLVLVSVSSLFVDVGS